MERQPSKRQASKAISPEMAFGQVLRAIRIWRNLSQQALADKSGYHRTYIGMLESGLKSPSLRTIFNLSTTLDTKPSDLLRRTQNILEKAQRGRERVAARSGPSSRG